MAGRAARGGVRSLEAFDFGSTADIIQLIPQDLFAELCERIIQHLNCQIPGVNTVELCQKFQAAGVEMNVADLAKIINVVSFLFSTAAKNNLSVEELSTGMGNAINMLPKHAVQVIRHLWNEKGSSISVSEDARNMATMGQVIDIQWKLGMAVSSDSCRSLKYPYITITLKVAQPSGQIMSKCLEMTIPQFQDFFRHFKDMAAVLETV
nr:COMM domain-containing protein 6 [Pelodiscus sinensis]|eukprot:XP_006117718.1 COMM domain-containing protein 6 [Pelodiscus sinensis]